MNTSELAWYKSSYSSSASGDCLEVATDQETIHIRDSKNGQGPEVHLSAAAWTAFLKHAAR
ncbi:DUF397 domain-containing protein [Streptomyces luteogriseus]|uniref:DUF397 domain-containing protein n=1 Tax=Streptomyces luteogriseus TaxID=68233 RepID=UPI0037AD7632